jgi:peptidoglycan/LPS O-acetylase OafA/YrhL
MVVPHQDPKAFDTLAYVIYKYVYGVLTFFFLASIILGKSPLHRILSFAPLVLVGQLSYGIYLIHRMGIQASEKILPFRHDTWWQSSCHLALTTGLVTAMAWLMWMVLERPCIALGRRLSNQMIRNAQIERESAGPVPQPAAPAAPAMPVMSGAAPSAAR